MSVLEERRAIDVTVYDEMFAKINSAGVMLSKELMRETVEIVASHIKEHKRWKVFALKYKELYTDRSSFCGDQSRIKNIIIVGFEEERQALYFFYLNKMACPVIHRPHWEH